MRARGGSFTLLALCLLSIVIASTTAASGSALPDANAQIEMLLTGRRPVAFKGGRGLSEIAPAPSSEYSPFVCPAADTFTSELSGSGSVQPPADKAVVNQTLPPPSPTYSTPPNYFWNPRVHSICPLPPRLARHFAHCRTQSHYALSRTTMPHFVLLNLVEGLMTDGTP